MPLASRAKVLMGIEATAGLLTTLLVVGRRDRRRMTDTSHPSSMRASSPAAQVGGLARCDDADALAESTSPGLGDEG